MPMPTTRVIPPISTILYAQDSKLAVLLCKELLSAESLGGQKVGRIWAENGQINN